MITQREFAEARIRGYRWVYEITERDGFWTAKAFIGGKLMHESGMWRDRIVALLVMNDMVNTNPYFK